MFAVMKGHTVEISFNNLRYSVRLNTVKDALTYLEVINKLAKRGEYASLPANFADELFSHLNKIGRIGPKRNVSHNVLHEKARLVSSLAKSRGALSHA
ncbi:hypothetical protein C1N60_23410 (plasmid) [Pantoea sp. SGAir0184]